MKSFVRFGDRVTSRFLVGEWEVVAALDGAHTVRITDANDNITISFPRGELSVVREDGVTRINPRYAINDAINQWVYDHPEMADLHHPDNVKELARYLRDQGLRVEENVVQLREAE